MNKKYKISEGVYVIDSSSCAGTHDPGNVDHIFEDIEKNFDPSKIGNPNEEKVCNRLRCRKE